MLDGADDTPDVSFCRLKGGPSPDALYSLLIFVPISPMRNIGVLIMYSLKNLLMQLVRSNKFFCVIVIRANVIYVNVIQIN